MKYINKYYILAALAAIIFIYYAVIAQNTYKSVATIDINKVTLINSVSSGLTSLLGFGGNTSKDAHLLKARLSSLDVLSKIDDKFKLIEHYSSSIDPFNSVSSDTALEEFQKFFNKRFQINLESGSGLINISLESFDGQFSHDVLVYMLDIGEAFINDVSNELAAIQTEFLEKKLKESYKRMMDAKNQILDFQNKKMLLNPESSAQISLSLFASLEAELVKKESVLSSMLFYLSEDSLEVKKLKEDIKIINEQINKEKSKIAGNADDKIAESIFEFQELKANAEFAQKIYKTNLVALEQANVEASRKSKTFTVIQIPNVPTSHYWPKLHYHYPLAIFLLTLVYFILILTYKAIKEHTA